MDPTGIPGEIAVLHLLIFNAAEQVQAMRASIGTVDAKNQARKTLKAVELAEVAIQRAKTPLRRMIRQR